MSTKKPPKKKIKKAGLAMGQVVYIPRLISMQYVWEGAFPYMLETYKEGEETFQVENFLYTSDSNFEKFLYDCVRKSTLPKWLKSNFIKIKKKIKDEIKHREKLAEKLSKEQQYAISLFFSNEAYFDQDDESEFFDLELEKAAITFLRAILDTRNYETFVRQGLRKRKGILSKHGRF